MQHISGLGKAGKVRVKRWGGGKGGNPGKAGKTQGSQPSVGFNF